MAVIKGGQVNLARAPVFCPSDSEIQDEMGTLEMMSTYIAVRWSGGTIQSMNRGP
jgi:hypothetical protein